MARFAARIEYLGTAYSGWQRLSHIVSVQQTLEEALGKIANHELRVQAAGRTDAGVHALGQIIHFDTDSLRDVRDWMLGTNANLPPDISVRWVREMDARFHARHDALQRHYRYVIHNSSARSAMSLHRAAFCPQPLNAQLMHEAGQVLVGTHDFSALRHSECQSRTPVRALSRLQVTRHDEWVVLELTANAFLHHMVRNIAGTLMEVGQGRQAPEWVAAVLASRDRKQAGRTAPPGGLTFLGPDYPEHCGVPPAPLHGFAR